MSEFRLTAITSSLSSEEGLKHAVLQSLLNWSKAQQNDPLEKDQSKQGWWANEFLSGVGCRDWTLTRSKQTSETLNRAKHHTEQALSWMITQNTATDIQVKTFYDNERLIRLINITLSNRTNYEITL